MKRTARLSVSSLSAALCLSICLGSASADPVLLSVNANYLDTTFSATGGGYSLGTLTVSDDANIVVEYDTGQITFDNGSFDMVTSLFSDDSVGGLVSGAFKDGSITIKDALDQDLLTADVISLRLDEVYNGCGLLCGSGLFLVTGGTLQTPFALDYGRIVQISFKLNLANVDDFQSDFAGVSNITLMPIPEPGTVLLVGTGLLVMVGFAIRRRMK